MEFDYDDAPTIAKFSLDPNFVRGLMGPFGSGKSSGCVIEIIKLALAQKPQHDGIRKSRFAVIRNTYPQLQDTTMRTFFDWLPHDDISRDGNGYGKFKISDHSYVITKLEPDLEIEILFRALDRPEHVSNLLSLELTGAWVNEAREVPWAIIQALQGRVGRFPSKANGGATDPRIIMDTNPPDDESWWFRKFEIEKPAGWAIFKQPSGISPQAENKSNLPDGYYERMLSMDSEAQKVYIHGQYGMLKEGKPVYTDYADNQHCQEFEPSPHSEIYVGWDFGLTPACVLTELTSTGQWRQFDEIVADDVYFPDFVEQVFAHVTANWPWLNFTDTNSKGERENKVHHWGDPSGTNRAAVAKDKDSATAMGILRGVGVRCRGGEQGILSRIGSVAYALNRWQKGNPTFLIHPRCRVTRRGFMGRYQYKKVQTSGDSQRFHEVPDKNEYSHPHDALQYVAHALFGQYIKNRDRKRSNRNKPLRVPSVGVR